MRKYFVYIITNKHNTVLYTGVTNDVTRRIFEHKNGLVKGFSKRYNCCKLVYIEECGRAIDAITREKQIKSVTRKKKEDLINSINPKWNDLSV